MTALLHDLAEPPIEEVGALPLNDFLSKADRKALAAGLSTLLASPTFASWREGRTLDVGEWLTARDGRTPAVIVSVAHLEDEERALVLGVLLEEVLAWVRSLPGSQRLRALVVFDEVWFSGAASAKSAHQAATRGAHEASPSLRRRRGGCQPKPHGSGLPSPRQRRDLVRRPPANRRRS